MKLALFFTVIFPLFAHAQKVDVKDVKPDTGAIIEIKKATPLDLDTNKWQVVSGQAEIVGDDAATTEEAKKTWKTACADWQKQFRQDNKDNQVLAVSCGVATCGGDAGMKSCSSHAKYKIKTQVN